MHGHGKLFVLNDDNRKDYDHVYKGTFVNGKKCGQGVIQYSNGDVYKGSFHNDAKHGEGIVQKPSTKSEWAHSVTVGVRKLRVIL